MELAILLVILMMNIFLHANSNTNYYWTKYKKTVWDKIFMKSEKHAG